MPRRKPLLTRAEIASTGGRGRKKKLTRQQRSDIARNAANARWNAPNFARQSDALIRELWTGITCDKCIHNTGEHHDKCPHAIAKAIALPSSAIPKL